MLCLDVFISYFRMIFGWTVKSVRRDQVDVNTLFVENKPIINIWPNHFTPPVQLSGP